MTAWPLNKWAREAIKNAETKFQNIDPVVVDPDSNKDTQNQKQIYIALEFLKHAASPAFMNHDVVSKDEDRLVKIGRSLVDLVALAAVGNGGDSGSNENEEMLRLALHGIVEQCDILALDDLKVPKVRFGKTEIQMPIATLGCMRFQQTWQSNIDTIDKINPEIQKNLKEIFKYAITHTGMNHIETAKGYGSSELQIGQVLQDLYKEGVTKREDLIIQTKVNPMKPKDFRKAVEESFKALQVDYIDLLSFHGANMDYQYDMIFKNKDGAENLIDIVREYQKEGKIRHIGFSTHGQPELIRKFIETDAFDYVNLHYHYFGSYTASGGGQYGGNLENIRLMKEKDMGVFIISAYDKGGRLYAPSKKLRSLTLPELEPIQFGSMWLWAHEDMDGEKAPIHTFTVGAARPSDLDEPAVAAYLFRTKKDEMLKKVKAVTKKLDDAKLGAFDEDWVKTWFHGVPNCLTENDPYNLGQIVSLYNMIKAWGMLNYAKDRYETFDKNRKGWDFNKSVEENIKKTGKVMWGYMPGITPDPGMDYSVLLSKVPEENRERLIEAIEFVYKTCSKTSNACPEIPEEWETAYDMRPWRAFPERG